MKALALRLAILIIPLTLAGTAQAAIVIRAPRPRVAIVVPAPRPGWLWVGGRWERRDSRVVFRESRWLPPARVFIEGRWYGRRWVPAHWR